MFFVGMCLLNWTLNHFLSSAPISFMANFHRSHHPLFQKFQASDSDWILMVGDSHVAGVSDELSVDLTEGKDHLFPAENLADLLNKPVLGIATPGGGPAAALQFNPSTGLDFLRKNYFEDLGDPGLIILVYYEGNDLDDDLKQAIVPFLKTHRLEDFNIQDLWQEHLDLTFFDHLPTQWWNPRRFLVGDFMVNKIKNLLTISSSKNRFTDVDTKTWNEKGFHEVKSGRFSLPVNVQGPAPELVDIQVSHAMKSLEHVLNFWKKKAPKAEILLVYMPSTWNTYELKPDSKNHVRSYHGIGTNFPTKVLEEKHLKLVELVKAVSAGVQVDFLDTTLELKKHSQTQPLHGPKDWNHLNKKGRSIFLESIVAHLKKKKI
jgi:hypothetical protein